MNADDSTLLYRLAAEIRRAVFFERSARRFFHVAAHARPFNVRAIDTFDACGHAIARAAERAESYRGAYVREAERILGRSASLL